MKLLYSILIAVTPICFTANAMRISKLVPLWKQSIAQKKFSEELLFQAEQKTSDKSELNLLIKNGGLINTCGGTYDQGLLVLASENGNLPMVQWLLQNNFTEETNKALHYSIISNINNEKNRNEISELLIDHGADVNVSSGSAFRWIILKGNEQLFSKFVEHPSLNIHVKGAFGENALEECVENGRILMFEKLLNMHGHLPQEYKDSCLVAAASKNQIVMVKKLLALGASIYYKTDAGDKLGEAWRLAQYYNYTKIVDLFDSVYEQDVKNKKPEAVNSLYYKCRNNCSKNIMNPII